MKKMMIRLGAILLVSIWLLWGNRALMVTEYTARSAGLPGGFSGFRIAQISDLHNTSFGADNHLLLQRLTQAKPDIIVITGDMIDYFHTDVEVALAFVEEAVKLAPVYYVTGNHEAATGLYDRLKTALKELGAVPLENEKVFLERAGERITLMGVMDPGFLPGPDGEAVAGVLTELAEPEDGYTILLSHRPELFETYVSAGTDLVFSGHAHGGQFRIPFIGGLYSPGQGWFPIYDAGQYTAGTTCMVVSRGLGNSRFPLRINNRPEIVVVELQSIPAN